MSRKFTPRIITVCGFSVFVGPCKSCPSAVEPWIKQFCSLPEHKWYVQIDTDWAVDWFNNYGLKEYFPNYEIALDMISDKHSHEWASMSDQNVNSIVIQAKQLYGLLHARWITQPSGLKQMKKKLTIVMVQLIQDKHASSSLMAWLIHGQHLVFIIQMNQLKILIRNINTIVKWKN